jgi:Protein kinase domain
VTPPAGDAAAPREQPVGIASGIRTAGRHKGDRLRAVSGPPEDPTVALGTGRSGVRRQRRASTAAIGSSISSSISSSSGASLGTSLDGTGTRSAPLEALERDELRRTRWFCYVSFAISLVAGASLWWLGGDPAAMAVLLGALAASALATVFMLYRTRDPIAFRRRSTALGWLVPAAATTAAIPYFGAFSPAPVVLVLGIFFTGLGKSRRLARVVYVVCAGVQGVVGLLAVAGITRDTGLVRAGYLDLRQQLIVQGLVQFVFATTLFVARMSRRTQLVAIEELEREVRISAHREALLLEAREQLDRALRPGRGRFSDQQIGGYLLGAVIGRGAMGEVYEASSPAGPVAIKLLSQASLGNPNHVLRFLRELRTAAAIVAPNVVRVLEVGEDPVPYLVMERLEGKTLAEVLRSRRVMAPADVVEMIRQIGAGITAARAACVVHRDLKPQNVFRHGEIWKILDFGIARALDQSEYADRRPDRRHAGLHGARAGERRRDRPRHRSLRAGRDRLSRADRSPAVRVQRSRRGGLPGHPHRAASPHRPGSPAPARGRSRPGDRARQAGERPVRRRR